MTAPLGVGLAADHRLEFGNGLTVAGKASEHGGAQTPHPFVTREPYGQFVDQRQRLPVAANQMQLAGEQLPQPLRAGHLRRCAFEDLDRFAVLVVAGQKFRQPDPVLGIGRFGAQELPQAVDGALVFFGRQLGFHQHVENHAMARTGFGSRFQHLDRFGSVLLPQIKLAERQQHGQLGRLFFAQDLERALGEGQRSRARVEFAQSHVDLPIGLEHVGVFRVRVFGQAGNPRRLFEQFPLVSGGSGDLGQVGLETGQLDQAVGIARVQLDGSFVGRERLVEIAGVGQQFGPGELEGGLGPRLFARPGGRDDRRFCRGGRGSGDIGGCQGQDANQQSRW